LEDDFDVVATMGHIKDLPKSKLGIDLEKNFEPNYIQVKKKGKQIKELQIAAKKADSVYLATDPDREGEAISEHVKEILLDKKILPKDKIKRIVFHEITESAVKHAIEKPGKVDEDLVEAQIARRVLDRLVGYKLSPLLWKKIRRGLSAGRVQSVAVRLIVERERERERREREKRKRRMNSRQRDRRAI
jgi:DNA topoisomerase-1